MTYRSTTYESDTFPDHIRLVSHNDMEFILEYLGLGDLRRGAGNSACARAFSACRPAGKPACSQDWPPRD